MTRILVNVFHPNLEASRGNAALVKAIRNDPRITINDAYAYYGESTAINVSYEQDLLARHDVVVFQHPLYWYAGPVLMKAWMEQVLTKGWAYPPGVGNALEGKVWAHAVTASGPLSAYRPGGYNAQSVSEYLAPYRGTARLCGASWHEPFAVYSVLGAGQEKSWSGAPNITEAELAEAAASYLRWIKIHA